MGIGGVVIYAHLLRKIVADDPNETEGLILQSIPLAKESPCKGGLDTMAEKKYSFKLKSSLAELDKLGRHLEKYGREIGLSKKCIFEINLALDELFTNIICYGFYGNQEHFIQMTIALENDEIWVCIEDDGIPFNPIKFEKPDMPHSIEECKIGGLGIHLVRKLINDICYRRCDDKNVLTLKKKVETSS